MRFSPAAWIRRVLARRPARQRTCVPLLPVLPPPSGPPTLLMPYQRRPRGRYPTD